MYTRPRWVQSGSDNKVERPLLSPRSSTGGARGFFERRGLRERACHNMILNFRGRLIVDSVLVGSVVEKKKNILKKAMPAPIGECPPARELGLDGWHDKVNERPKS